ncbi:ABC transporter permease [Actinomadura sp. CNU-125]|uniref:ABC transporter permease n=1 Tax=Actinomadura sp. CNU-125 TaxID=1904961 RepID=UPI0009FB06A9|nr:ABC transporter permease [Actinomadura sp. CNU-125]
MTVTHTLPVPEIPRSPLGRLRWAAADGWTLTRRALAHWVKRPEQLAIGLAFPVLLVLMMGYLFGGQMEVPGGDYREFIIPGMFAMTMVFGVEATFTAIAVDAAKGVSDRFRAMPMAPSAVVVGRGAADLVDALAALSVMALCGLAMGWRAHDGIVPALAGLGLLLLLRFALIWVGVYLGLLAKGPESVMVIQILVWPIGFLSSAMVAPSTMPGWLGTIAEWNPMSATVTACRDLFGDPALAALASDSWASDNALLLAVAWPLAITAVFFPLAVRRYRAIGR